MVSQCDFTFQLELLQHVRYGSSGAAGGNLRGQRPFKGQASSLLSELTSSLWGDKPLLLREGQVPEGQSVSDLCESPQGKCFLILFTQNPRGKALKRSLEEAYDAILDGLHFY